MPRCSVYVKWRNDLVLCAARAKTRQSKRWEEQRERNYSTNRLWHASSLDSSLQQILGCVGSLYSLFCFGGSPPGFACSTSASSTVRLSFVSTHWGTSMRIGRQTNSGKRRRKWKGTKGWCDTQYKSRPLAPNGWALVLNLLYIGIHYSIYQSVACFIAEHATFARVLHVYAAVICNVWGC